jgi:arsenite methyltransferase
MADFLTAEYNLNDPKILSVIDDMPLWSAPFGLKLLSVVQYKRNIRILDIGTGLGFPLIELAMRLGSSCRLVGLDPWKTGLRRARQKIQTTGIRNVELVAGVAEAIPFKNSTFDLVISNNGLNNVSNLEKSLHECARVSKKEAQFVITYNTDRTFHEFYTHFRKSLRETGLKFCLPKVDQHIYSKRKPLTEYQEALTKSGFTIRKVYKDAFRYQFCDGTSMLNHFMMKLSFLPSWKEIVPAERRNEVFQKVEEKMNLQAAEEGVFIMSVPFATFDCRKT